MASRRSFFVDAAETSGHYFQDRGYIYQAPYTQTQTHAPLRAIPVPAPVRVSEDYYSQMYTSPAPAPAPTPTTHTNIFPTCCRRPRRASRHSKAYDSDGSTDSYASTQDDVSAQSERLPPRIALKKLSDCLQEATIFYNTQLINFAREHQLKGHDTSNEDLRQWLWNDWVRRRDSSTLEEFTSTKTSITLLLRQAQVAVATPWLDDADLKARFDFSFKALQSMCGEIARLAEKAMSDWQACRFLAVELKNAKVYANPEGTVQRHLFVGWDEGELW